MSSTLTPACTILPPRANIPKMKLPVVPPRRFVALEALLLQVDFYIYNLYENPMKKKKKRKKERQDKKEPNLIISFTNEKLNDHKAI